MRFQIIEGKLKDPIDITSLSRLYDGVPLPSVTIFGENLPLWQNKPRIWQLFDGLFSIWQKFEPIFAKNYAIRQIFINANGQILNRYLAIWSL